MRLYVSYILAYIVIIISLVACSPAMLKKTDDIANIAVINNAITSGDVMAVVTKVQLTDFEKAVVVHARNRYERFLDDWKGEIFSLESTSPLYTRFLNDYAELVVQYKLVSGIVAKNWEGYSNMDRIILSDWQRRAAQLDNTVNDLINAGQTYKAVIQAVEVGKIVLSIATKVLVP